MRRKRISKKTREKFKKTIRNVIGDLSREVLVYLKPRISECPNCFYDKLTNSSTGKCKWNPVEARDRQQAWENAGHNTLRYKYFRVGRCPVCNGKGYLETQRKRWVDALVIWNPGSRIAGNDGVYVPAGSDGTTTVELKMHPRNYELIKDCTKIVVDGIECRLSRPPLLRGLGNESVLIVIAYTSYKFDKSIGDTIKEYD